jgi:hypothetical protein
MDFAFRLSYREVLMIMQHCSLSSSKIGGLMVCFPFSTSEASYSYRVFLAVATVS